MNKIEAVIKVLKRAGKPLKISEITKRILKTKLWSSVGETPVNAVSTKINYYIKKKDKKAKL